MKLLPLLALLLTPTLLPAANVLYSLDGENPQRHILSFVTNGFITELPPIAPGLQIWSLLPSQTLKSPCETFVPHPCRIIISGGDGESSINAPMVFDRGEILNALEGIGQGFPMRLDQFGSAKAGPLTNVTFSITPTDLPPTVTPEPATALLLLSGLVPLLVYARARFQPKPRP